jgi:hypothetical protein
MGHSRSTQPPNFITHITKQNHSRTSAVAGHAIQRTHNQIHFAQFAHQTLIKEGN